MVRVATRLCALALMIISSMLLLSAAAWSARAEFEVNSLRGLDGVVALTNKLNPDFAKDGLTSDSVQQIVEQRLKAGGIKVLSKDDITKSPGTPLLLVNISLMESEPGMYAYSLDLELYQVVLLARDTEIPSLARTWSEGIVGSVSASNMKQLNTRISSLIDEFVSDFMTANMKVQQG